MAQLHRHRAHPARPGPRGRGRRRACARPVRRHRSTPSAARCEEIIGSGPAAPSGHIPFTPRAKAVLELSLREALQLGHNHIGTEHILLGLLREGEGVAAQVLGALGADLTRVRSRRDRAARRRVAPSRPSRRSRAHTVPSGRVSSSDRWSCHAQAARGPRRVRSAVSRRRSPASCSPGATARSSASAALRAIVSQTGAAGRWRRERRDGHLHSSPVRRDAAAARPRRARRERRGHRPTARRRSQPRTPRSSTRRSTSTTGWRDGGGFASRTRRRRPRALSRRGEPPPRELRESRPRR